MTPNAYGINAAPTSIINATDAEVAVIREAWAVWATKRPGNFIKSLYYDGKNRVRSLGISTPANITARIDAVLGWGELAVSSLSDRLVFEGFVHESDQPDPLGLAEVMRANRFELELPQAYESALKHSCAFITITKGDVQAGEPEVVIQARSAEYSAGLWDSRRRRMYGMLAITAISDTGAVTAFDMYLDGVVLRCTVAKNGKWVADRLPQPVGEVLAEPILYKPSLDRPFGHSRISRAVRSTIDLALRSITRGEVGAEWYSLPRIVAMGLAESAFDGGGEDAKFRAAATAILAFTRDEDGQLPELKQLPATPPQPNIDQFKHYATMFASLTGIPVSQLGVVADSNPASAEAMLHAERGIINAANVASRQLTVTLREIARKVTVVRDGKAHPEVAGLEVAWANPAFIDPVTRSDALVKLASVFPWLSESETALEFAGFTRAQIRRLAADKARAAGTLSLNEIFGGINGQQSER